MRNRFRSLFPGLPILLGLATGPSAMPFTADVEIDPTAYVFDGYSLHAGIWTGHWRVDLGAFAMDVPEAVLANDDFSATFHGYGVKLQYFPRADRTGPFAGIDGGVTKALVQSASSNAANYATRFGAGVNAGWAGNTTSRPGWGWATRSMSGT